MMWIASASSASRWESARVTSVIASDRALALAALHHEGHLALPVDELAHRLQPELDGHGEVADRVLEVLGPDARGVGVEHLAVLALVLVGADPALDRLGHALGGQAHLQPGPVDDLAAFVVAADVGDVGGDRVLADLDRRAVEPDVADVVLAAAVGAARHLDVDPARQRVGDPHRLDPLLDGAVEAHRAGDAELAGVRAGAGDDVVDLVRAGLAEAERVEALPHVVDRLVADPAQHEVLVHGGAGVAAAEVAHDLREPAELLRREVAARDLDLHRAEAPLALRLDVGRAEALERGAVAVGRAVGVRNVGGVGLLVVEEHAVLDREVALGDPVALELLVDHAAHLVDADLVHEHLDPRAGAVDAQPVLAVEDAEHRLGPHEVRAVVGGHEVDQGRGDARHDRRAAADAALEAPHAVALARDERDVMDAGQRAVAGGAAERRLDLARHQLRRRVAHEVAHEGARVGGRVEQLVGAHARPGVGGHVAHGVAAALPAGQAGLGQLADVGGGVAERDVVHLDVLPRRDVTLAERDELLDRARERVHLVGRDAAPRELDADHLDVGLPLAVYALLQAEADELVLRRLTVEVLLRLVVEVVELALEDRDDVPGNVLAHLGISERPLAAGRGRRLHPLKVP